MEKSFLGVNRSIFSREGFMRFIRRSMAEKIGVKSD